MESSSSLNYEHSLSNSLSTLNTDLVISQTQKFYKLNWSTICLSFKFTQRDKHISKVLLKGKLKEIKFWQENYGQGVVHELKDPSWKILYFSAIHRFGRSERKIKNFRKYHKNAHRWANAYLASFCRRHFQFQHLRFEKYDFLNFLWAARNWQEVNFEQWNF